nr:probable E3 ubiquitin-protein ligase RNF217 [Ipomoea batatas]GMD74959.1 probable E3 ubiquitin-protein ligase RNF217 [Ipomoea batatas]GME21746.1 probable E3 ubiquitin-protein ligase RNF217 [Ipomoea batatas]
MEAYGTTMMKAISVEDYKRKSVIMVAESSGYASKLQQNVPQINCLVSGCTGVVEPHNCRSILPPQVFDRWGDALCEALVLASEKFYHPFKDCSALLIEEKIEVAESVLR